MQCTCLLYFLIFFIYQISKLTLTKPDNNRKMTKIPSDPRYQNLNFKSNQAFFTMILKLKRQKHYSLQVKGFFYSKNKNVILLCTFNENMKKKTFL